MVLWISIIPYMMVRVWLLVAVLLVCLSVRFGGTGLPECQDIIADVSFV